MKTAIFQYYKAKDKVPDSVRIVTSRFKRYADAIGADYIFDDECNNTGNVYFENLRVIYDEMFDQYDKVLYADTDIVVENFKENIFNEDIKEIGMVPEIVLSGMCDLPFHTFPHIELEYRSWASQFSIPIYKPTLGPGSYLMLNSGIIVWTKKGREKAKKRFMGWQQWHNTVTHRHLKLDQPYINGQVQKHLQYTELPSKWNMYPRTRFKSGLEPKEINFVHYTGGKKEWIGDLYE